MANGDKQPKQATVSVIETSAFDVVHVELDGREYRIDAGAGLTLPAADAKRVAAASTQLTVEVA